MQFQLRKEILENRYMAGYGRLEWCSMYIVSQGDKKIGQFFLSDEVAFYAFEEEDVRIDYKRRFLRQTLYPIIDQKTQQPFGGYDKRDYSSPSTPYGKMFLGEAMYVTKKINYYSFKGLPKVDVFEVGVGNLQEAVLFNIQITRPQTWYRRPRLYRGQLAGTVKLTGNNLHLLFGSLFLLEQVVLFEDETTA